MFDSQTIKKFQSIDTPFYYYDLSLLKKTLDLYTTELKKYNYHAHYALRLMQTTGFSLLLKTMDWEQIA